LVAIPQHASMLGSDRQVYRGTLAVAEDHHAAAFKARENRT